MPTVSFFGERLFLTGTILSFTFGSMCSFKQISLSEAIAAWREEIARPSFWIAAPSAVMVTIAATLAAMVLMAHEPTSAICVMMAMVLLPAFTPYVQLFNRLDKLLFEAFFKRNSCQISYRFPKQDAVEFQSIVITPPKSPPRQSARRKAEVIFYNMLFQRARRAVILHI